jgi:hypothetical protein
VRAIHARGDRIYLIDLRPIIIRVYDREGTFLFNLGRRGSGPGEYLGPAGIAVNPESGTTYIRDAALSRFNLYDASGRYLESWRLRSGSVSLIPPVMTHDGRLFSVARLPQPTGQGWLRYGLVEVTSAGTTGDTLAVPAWDHRNRIVEFSTPDGLLAMRVPFSPEVVWAMSPTGAMLSGISDRYRIERHHPVQGSLIIERIVDQVALHTGERAWHRSGLVEIIRESAPGWNWSGPDFPTHKPFFDAIIPDDAGRCWVLRRGQGYLTGPTDESGAARWADRYLLDVFREDGTYLGEVALPDELISDVRPSITGNSVHLMVTGIGGEPILKRYRLATGSMGPG